MIISMGSRRNPWSMIFKGFKDEQSVLPVRSQNANICLGFNHLANGARQKMRAVTPPAPAYQRGTTLLWKLLAMSVLALQPLHCP